MKIPDKVRAGEKLSARWLNQLIDCLTDFSKATGIGGASGQSRSSIKFAGGPGKDTKYRELEGLDFPLFIEKGFELRIKPEHLCPSSDEGYTKILQVRSGLIVDYRGHEFPVPNNTGSSTSGEDFAEDGSSASDYFTLTTWTDMFEISETPQSVYCIIRQDSRGEVTSAYFSLSPEPFQSWKAASGSGADSSEGVVSVLIGSAYSAIVEERSHFYIDQIHIGAIELQVCADMEEESGSGSGSLGSGSVPGSGSGSGSVAPDCDCIRYEFDPQWFIVSGNYITLNSDTINQIVQEAVNEISLDVQVTGLVEATAYGDLSTSTSASGSLDGSLAATSNVSY